MTIAPPTRTTTYPTRRTREPKAWVHRSLSVGSSLLFAAIATAYLIIPGWWQWVTASPYHVRDQVATAEPAENQPLLAQLRAIPDAPAHSPPVVLVYHNISEEPGFYTVTPQAFAAQMQLLHDTGYTTITANQLTAWLRGGTLPPRPVLLTFDDGVEGVWQAADPILARYQQHAMAFIITGFVGTRPYYMNWPEVVSLGKTGRWDIESHTALGHVNFTIDARGTQGPFLTNRHYLSVERRIETTDEYRSRITNDLAQSVKDIRDHGLPTPTVFAYPFSASTGDPTLTAILDQAVRSLFLTSMLDESGGATTDSADLAAGHLRRTDVTSDVDLATWVENIRKSVTLAAAGSNPLAHPDDWTDAAGHPVHLDVTNGVATLNPGDGWAGYLYAPSRTRGWKSYAVSATLGGLRTPGDGTIIGLRVYADTVNQVQLTVSADGYEIRRGTGDTQQLMASGALPRALSYPVRIDARPEGVTIDSNGHQLGRVKFRATGTMPPGLPVTGGIELTAQREKSTAALPRVSNLVVEDSVG